MDEEEKKKKKKRRINNGEATVLILMAIIFDVLSLWPAINVVVVVIAQAFTALFFLLNRVNIFSGGYKKLVPYLIACVAEAIPFVSIVPMITVETIVIIGISRAEDKAGISVTPGIASKITGGSPTP
ncbi:MAG TPA: hypothetical protein VGE35_00150 [Candidatus Paceibacterota bacterium]